MNLFLKGLLMTAITFVATSFAANGLPDTLLAWQILGLTTVGTLAVYVAQSISIPTTSAAGDFNYRDILKGAIVAVGNFLSVIGTSEVLNTSFTWQEVLKSVGTVLVAYLIKQFASKSAQK